LSILYTTTAYPPAVGGAQLHLHELVKRISECTPVGVMYHWDTNRTDWLLGTTLDAPQGNSQPHSYDTIPVAQITLSPLQRRDLRLWVWSYLFIKGQALNRISSAIQAQIEAIIPALLSDPPQIVHNSRIGREGITLASFQYARQTGIPFVLTPNHHHHWSGWLYRHYLDLYRRADALITYTHYEQAELVRLGVHRERIYVLGIGPILAPTYDAHRFRIQQHIPDDAPIILFLGQKYRYKRIQLLLDATRSVWAKHPTTRFVFIGPRTAYSTRLFAQYRDERICELDTVDLQTKTDALAACNVLCMPSGRESFGGVYVEAWTLGKPVIGGDAPAVREVIEEGVNGYTVGSDADQLAQRLNLLLHDPELARSLGAAGQVKAASYDWAILSRQLLDVYHSLM